MPGSWTKTKPLPGGRWEHTATRLVDGRVLVVGGRRGSKVVEGSCVYDPTTRAWTEAARPAHPRHEHAATLLHDGRVLIAGGRAKDVLAREAEVFDPATGRWSSVGETRVDRVSPFLFAEGDRVWLLGGNGLSDLQAESLCGGGWEMNAPWPARLWGFDAAPLPSGDVLVLGGTMATTRQLWLWTPRSGTVQPAGELGVSRGSAPAVGLGDGRVLITGGEEGGSPPSAHASCELWDGALGRCVPTGSLSGTRTGHRTTRLADGRVLVTGGRSSLVGELLASAEVWDPATGAWSDAGSLAKPVTGHTATLLATGEVLVAGGGGAGPAVAVSQLWTG